MGLKCDYLQLQHWLVLIRPRGFVNKAHPWYVRATAHLSDTTAMPPASWHQCCVACHSTSHTQTTVPKWQPVRDAYESWPTTSHLLSQPFHITTVTILVVKSMEVCILGDSYIPDDFSLMWVNLSHHFLIRVLWGLPFCQKSMLAVVQAVVGCNRVTCHVKWYQFYPFHTHHLWLLHSQVTLCGVALSSHMEKIAQNLLELLLHAMLLWLLSMCAVALAMYLTSETKMGPSLRANTKCVQSY